MKRIVFSPETNSLYTAWNSADIPAPVSHWRLPAMEAKQGEMFLHNFNGGSRTVFPSIRSRPAGWKDCCRKDISKRF